MELQSSNQTSDSNDVCFTFCRRLKLFPTVIRTSFELKITMKSKQVGGSALPIRKICLKKCKQTSSAIHMLEDKCQSENFPSFNWSVNESRLVIETKELTHVEKFNRIH